jgi:formylglycine-generating enzyme required for sulfatase activity
MGGNVAEWVSDYYDPTFYSAMTVTDPEQTTSQGLGRAIRGGSYAQPITFSRVSNRAQPTFFASAAEVGFRCAKDAP